MDLGIDIVIMINICLNFLLEYEQKGEYVQNRTKIALGYLKGAFIIDVASSIPYQFFAASGV